jgi:hypothetical protein
MPNPGSKERIRQLFLVKHRPLKSHPFRFGRFRRRRQVHEPTEDVRVQSEEKGATMKLLVATTETQGQRNSDFCYVPEGELLIFAFECANDRGNVDGGCGCVRSMDGIDSKTGTTTFRVAEAPITAAELKAKLAAHYPSIKLSDEMLVGEVLSLVELARPYEVGVILEKRAPNQNDDDPQSALRVRRNMETVSYSHISSTSGCCRYRCQRMGAARS